MTHWQPALVALLVSFSCWTTVRGQEAPNSKSLIAKQKWIRFAMIRGRIVALAPHGQNAAMSSPEGDAPSETFGVHVQGNTTLVRYERVCSRQTVRIRFLGESDVLLERESQRPELPPIRLRQPAKGDIVLEIGAPPHERTLRAPTLWHLLLSEPELGREQIIPLLEILRPDWRLASHAEHIETTLFAQDPFTPAVAWRSLIDQLGDPRFPVRQAADRELRSYGQRIVPYLENLDMACLNAEQKSRVRSIRTALRDQVEDSPPRVAAWLVNDVRVWTALAERETGERCSMAHAHLARLSGKGPDEIRAAADSFAKTGTLNR